MQEALRFILLGLGIGALYALAATGLIIIYRGSGVLNFAHGAIGGAGAFFAIAELQARDGWAYIPAAIAGVLLSALLGMLTSLIVMRPLRQAAPLARIVGTLGVLITVQSVLVLRYGSDTIVVKSWLPTKPVSFGGSVSISEDRLWLMGIAAVLTLILWAVYRFTKFGIGTTSVAENERAAASLGWSPDVIATVNWTLGSALAGLVAILIAPIVQLQVTTMTTVVIAAMAAALVASFQSFPLAFAGGLIIGIGQSLLTRYSSTPGLAQSVPFIIIVIVLIVGGRSLPLRDYFLQRLPAVGTGRIRPAGVLAGLVAGLLLVVVVPTTWLGPVAATYGIAVILLSLVVLTGYAGQISLGQYALAGIGAWIAGRLSATHDWPFLLAALAGVVVAVGASVLFALPAVRTRGINLAIVTLGLGSAIEQMIFNNPDLTGGFAGTNVHEPTIFGLNVDPITHPARYAIVCLGGLILVTLVVGSLRRSRSGRRLLAVRTNERAAAALGIGVTSTKLYAFTVSSAIAAVGGVLVAFQFQTLAYSDFASLASVTAMGYAFIGGIGFLMGPVIGATLAPGALGNQIGSSLFSGLGDWVPLIGGVILIMMVIQNQNGAASRHAALGHWVAGKMRPGRDTTPAATALPETTRERVPQRRLDVRGLTVRYGTVTAADGVDLTVPPGRVIGLIGPNGAGKTTVIDAITGFTPMVSGTVELDGQPLTGMRAGARARRGLSRSFQSLELFEDLTVLDNLRAASDPRDRLSYVRDLVYPVNPPLSGEVVAAIEAFELGDVLDRRVESLPYGQRRLVAIARAVASAPSVLLLDEPAAGLSEHESAELAKLVRTLPDEWGMGVLLVEHDMNFVMSICDEIVVLDFGRPIAHGTPNDIRADQRVVSAYLGEAAETAPSTAGVRGEA